MLSIVKLSAPILFVAAFVSSLAWLIFSPEFEPVITSVVLLASIIAIFADKYVSLRERRRELLIVLAHELFMNLGVYKQLSLLKEQGNISKPSVYPRYYNTSLASVIASGVFLGKKDRELWKCMNGWLQRSSEANVRLNLSEFRVFTNEKEASLFNKKVTEGAVAIDAMNELHKLAGILMSKYNGETGIDNETVLFGDDDSE